MRRFDGDGEEEGWRQASPFGLGRPSLRLGRERGRAFGSVGPRCARVGGRAASSLRAERRAYASRQRRARPHAPQARLLQCADARHCSAQRVRPTHRRQPARVDGAARAAEDRGSRPLLLGAAAHPRRRAGPVGRLPARCRRPQLDLPGRTDRIATSSRSSSGLRSRCQQRPSVLCGERARRVGGRGAGGRPRRRRGLPANHAGRWASSRWDISTSRRCCSTPRRRPRRCT